VGSAARGSQGSRGAPPLSFLTTFRTCCWCVGGRVANACGVCAGKKDLAPVGKPCHLRMRPTAALVPQLEPSASTGGGGRGAGSGSVGAGATAVLLLLLDPSLAETDYWAPPMGNATRLAMNVILPLPPHATDSTTDHTADLEASPWASSSSTTMAEAAANNSAVGAALASLLTLDGASVTPYLPSDPRTAVDFELPAAGPLPSVGVLQGGAVAAVRLFHADACGGGFQGTGAVRSSLRGVSGDDGGLQFHALHLETLLYEASGARAGGSGDVSSGVAGNASDVRVACGDSGFLRVGLLVGVADVLPGADGAAALAGLEAGLAAAAASAVSTAPDGDDSWAVDLTLAGAQPLVKNTTAYSLSPCHHPLTLF